MSDFISREDLGIGYANPLVFDKPEFAHGWNCAIEIIQKAPTVDAVEVVRCKDCRYYHKEHVLCNDGSEKDVSEFPPEAFGLFGFVTAEYGITVGGKCEIEKNCGYAEDKSVFRQPIDFCSRGEMKGEMKKDGAAQV